MLDFASVAIFMLGTSIKNSRFPQPQPTYYESRIVPIYESWASFFPDVYFVFGTNQYDYKFLQDHACELKEHDGDAAEFIVSASANKFAASREGDVASQKALRRRLKASARQIPASNATYMFWCSVTAADRHWSYPSDYYHHLHHNSDNTSTSTDGNPGDGGLANRLHHWIDSKLFHHDAEQSQPPVASAEQLNVVSKAHQHHLSLQLPNRPIKVLLTGNCTGEYFGIGPTCRCQETMRYFYRHLNSTFAHIQWFLFMDDDIYFRPFSLLSLLRHVERDASIGINHHYKTGQTVALVGAGSSHGDQLKPKLTNDAHILEQCLQVLGKGYSFAQPALLNRQAMLVLQTAIESHAMTSMHVHWGGSHDSILGFVLWMLDVPTYSFNKHLFPTRVLVHNVRKTLFTHKLHQENSVFVHHVICADQYQFKNSGKQRKAEVQGRIACQYDVAEMFGDDVMYRNQSFGKIDQIDVEKYYLILQKQWQAGVASSKALFAIANTSVSNIRRTVFRERADKLPQHFEPFTPFDCKLHPNPL